MYDRENTIYVGRLKPPIVTVIIGAMCSDGIVLIADRKITDMTGNTLQYTNKIFADMEHILIGYGGGINTFDIFRKYIVGDIIILRNDKNNRYTFDNFIPKIKESVLRFNKFVSDLNYNFEIVAGKHRKDKSELYYIKHNGEAIATDYISIGSGKETTDMFLENIKNKNIEMRKFAKLAYLSIMYMDKYLPNNRVGVEPSGFPTIKYLDYSKDWDEEATEEEIREFRTFSEEKLKEYDNHLKNLINSL